MGVHPKHTLCKTCGLEITGDRLKHLRNDHHMDITDGAHLNEYYTNNRYVFT